MFGIYDFAEGKIHQVLRLDNDQFFVIIKSIVYLYNSKNNNIQLLLSFNEEPVTIRYENQNSQLYIAFADKLEIYSYPALQKLASLTAPFPIKSLDFRYAY
jgi:hypothetical protein